MKTIKEQAAALIETAKANGVEEHAVVSQEQAELIVRTTSIETSIRAIANLIDHAYAAQDYAEADRLQLAKEAMMQIKSETEAMMPRDTSFDFLQLGDYDLDIVD